MFVLFDTFFGCLSFGWLFKLNLTKCGVIGVIEFIIEMIINDFLRASFSFTVIKRQTKFFKSLFLLPTRDARMSTTMDFRFGQVHQHVSQNYNNKFIISSLLWKTNLTRFFKKSPKMRLLGFQGRKIYHSSFKTSN